MTGRRSRFNLVGEILEAIEDGNNKPTHILYETKLSWAVLQDLLGLLQDRGYVEKRIGLTAKNTENYRYFLTENGEEALTNLRNLQNSIRVEPMMV